MLQHGCLVTVSEHAGPTLVTVPQTSFSDNGPTAGTGDGGNLHRLQWLCSLDYLHWNRNPLCAAASLQGNVGAVNLVDMVLENEPGLEQKLA